MKLKILINGYGGDGILTLGKILAQSAIAENKIFLEYHDYSVEIRGGWVYSSIIISDSEIFSPVVDTYDIAIFFDKKLAIRDKDRIDKSTIIIGQETQSTTIHTNMFLLGKLIKKTKLFRTETIKDILKRNFPENRYRTNWKEFIRGMKIEN